MVHAVGPKNNGCSIAVSAVKYLVQPGALVTQTDALGPAHTLQQVHSVVHFKLICTFSN